MHHQRPSVLYVSASALCSNYRQLFVEPGMARDYHQQLETHAHAGDSEDTASSISTAVCQTFFALPQLQTRLPFNNFIPLDTPGAPFQHPLPHLHPVWNVHRAQSVIDFISDIYKSLREITTCLSQSTHPSSQSVLFMIAASGCATCPTRQVEALIAEGMSLTEYLL